MKEIACASLDEFLSSYQGHFPAKGPESVGFSDIVFRGQGDSSYGLASTLERFTKKIRYSLTDYVHVILKAYAEFSSYTQHRFEFDEQEIMGVASNCA